MLSWPTSKKIPEQEELAADLRGLRLLLETFQLEPEIQLGRKLNDSSTRREIGKLIGPKGRGKPRS
jgi:hypothetical protein